MAKETATRQNRRIQGKRQGRGVLPPIKRKKISARGGYIMVADGEAVNVERRRKKKKIMYD